MASRSTWTALQAMEAQRHGEGRRGSIDLTLQDAIDQMAADLEATRFRA